MCLILFAPSFASKKTPQANENPVLDYLTNLKNSLTSEEKDTFVLYPNEVAKQLACPDSKLPQLRANIREVAKQLGFVVASKSQALKQVSNNQSPLFLFLQQKKQELLQKGEFEDYLLFPHEVLEEFNRQFQVLQKSVRNIRNQAKKLGFQVASYSESAKKRWTSGEERQKASKRTQQQWAGEYGELQKTRRQSSEYSQERSKMMKELWQTLSYQQKMATVRQSPEYLAKRRDLMLTLWQTPSYKQSMATVRQSPEYKALRSEMFKVFWQRPESRQKQSNVQKKRWEEYRSKNPPIQVFSMDKPNPITGKVEPLQDKQAKTPEAILLEKEEATFQENYIRFLPQCLEELKTENYKAYSLICERFGLELDVPAKESSFKQTFSAEEEERLYQEGLSFLQEKFLDLEELFHLQPKRG